MLANCLIFLSPFSLFSIKVMGFELYPQYLFFPLGFILILSRLCKGRTFFLTRSSLIFISFLFLLVSSVLTRLYLFADLFKIIIMLVSFWGISYSARKDFKTFSKIVDVSICVLVLYGLFQYIMVLFGKTSAASWLHEVIGYEGHGGPVDSRGGVTRVASLTKEPSYFAFIVGIYFFITKKNLVKVACAIGMLISFSLITIYSVSGIAFYRFCKFLKIKPIYIFFIIVAVHILFVLLYFEIIPEILLPTFEERYAGIVYLISDGSLLAWLFGAFQITSDSPVNLVHPYSNIGSILLIYGVIGMTLYLFFFDSIAKKCRYPYAVYALFLFGINFYYLTAWPIILIFFVFFLLPQDNNAQIQCCHTSL